MKKRDYINLTIIILTVLVIMFITKGYNNLYGSKTDWMSQHWALPEYFRNLFYETKNLFPNFAPNIGAGQNIYNFAYYGFLNPIILISYFFPFIKMVDYIMISSIIVVIMSIILFYKWLINNKVEVNNAFIATFLFALANPLIYHSHRHIMFINYMPFLILALIGIDKYFENKKSWLLIISVFLIIMTSYFYSVGCLVVLGTYSLYKILKNNYSFKETSKHILKLLLAILVSILMSAILLLPTIYVIKSGRGIDTHSINLFTLLTPNFNINSILYTSYSPGLTAFALICLVGAIFSEDRSIKFLGIFISVLLFIPVFAYLLNGMLYVRYKVFIPFLPLIGFLISHFLSNLKEEKISIIKIILFIILIIVFNQKDKIFLVFIIDVIITLLCICFYKFNNIKKIFYIPIILIAMLSSVYGNFQENYVTKANYLNDFNINDEMLIKEIINKDNSLYRFSNLESSLSTSNKVYHTRHYQTTLYSSTYNFNYNDFYYDVFKNAIPYRNRVITATSPNIFFQTLMGIKYIGTKNNSPVGYQLVGKNDNNFAIYKNDNVFPLVYSTNNTMSINDFTKLEYPYTISPLLTGVVVNDKTNYQKKLPIKEVSFKYDSEVNDNIDLIQSNNEYIINSKKKGNIKLFLEEKQNNILIITFKMKHNQKCSKGDTGISINGITNKLTCREWIYHNQNFEFEYVISSNEPIDMLNINFEKGKYIISDIKTYIVDYQDVINHLPNIDKIEIDMNKTKGDVILGDIKVTNDGYLVTTIPYDEGFTIKLNGIVQNKEKVNTSFLGTKIKKGDYQVEIIYKSPFYQEGLLISLIGFISCFFIIVIEQKKNN